MLCRIRSVYDSVALTIEHVAFEERALGVADKIMRHPFVASEICALQLSVRRDHAGELVAVEFMAVLIPEQLLAGEPHAIQRADTDPASELPYLVFVIV